MNIVARRKTSAFRSNVALPEMTAESSPDGHGLRVLRGPAVLSLFLAFLASTPAHAQAPVGPNRPAGVPDGYVITPFGYSHPSCVRQLREGETLLADGGVIQHTDGTLENISACDYPHYTARGELVAADAAGVAAPRIDHSWIVDAEAKTRKKGTSYGKISATWTVPQAPTSKDGPTVLFFPGLEDIDATKHNERILQPVLAWNNEFTRAWGITSWDCCWKGNRYHSEAKLVASGDTILGTVESTCTGNPNCPLWNVTTEDTNSGASTTLSDAPSNGLTFNWAFAGVLEVYDVAHCSDYPPNGLLIFSGVALYDDNFKLIADPGWLMVDDSGGLTPQCGYGGQVAATNVTLDYSPYAKAVLSDKPIAYYRLGEKSTSDPAADSSGKGNTGAYENNPVLGVPGLIADTDNTAVNFATGDVVIPDAADLEFVNAPFTIEAWVNGPYSSFPTYGRVFDKITAGYIDGYGLDLGATGVRLLGCTDFEPPTPLTDNTKYHVVGVSDGKGKGYIYVNGQLVASGAYSSCQPYTGAAHIAVASDGTTAHFDGVIDEVAVYNHVLSEQRILAHYHRGIGQPE